MRTTVGSREMVPRWKSDRLPPELEQQFSKWGPQPVAPHHLGLFRHTEDQAPPRLPESETGDGVQHVTGASCPADSDP